MNYLHSYKDRYSKPIFACHCMYSKLTWITEKNICWIPLQASFSLGWDSFLPQSNSLIVWLVFKNLLMTLISLRTKSFVFNYDCLTDVHKHLQ
jgi:hypothetical protein